MSRTSKKDSVLRFRLPTDVKDAFLLWCHAQGVAPSLALRTFILQEMNAPTVHIPHAVTTTPNGLLPASPAPAGDAFLHHNENHPPPPRTGLASDIVNLTDF